MEPLRPKPSQEGLRELTIRVLMRQFKTGDDMKQVIYTVQAYDEGKPANYTFFGDSNLLEQFPNLAPWLPVDTDEDDPKPFEMVVNYGNGNKFTIRKDTVVPARYTPRYGSQNEQNKAK